MTITTAWQTVTVADGSKLPMFTALPDGVRRPGVLVLQEAFGVNHHVQEMVRRIAMLGYVACAPELFHRTAPHGWEGDYHDFAGTAAPHMQAMTDDSLAADLTAAHGWLADQSSVDNAKIAATGYCMGGRAAFLANAVLPLACAVSYYGGRIAPGLLPRAAAQHGPLLFFWGGADTHIPATDRAQLRTAMDAAGKPYVDVVFADAPHAFSNDDRAGSFHPAATRQAWALFTQFLADNFAEE